MLFAMFDERFYDQNSLEVNFEMPFFIQCSLLPAILHSESG